MIVSPSVRCCFRRFILKRAILGLLCTAAVGGMTTRATAQPADEPGVLRGHLAPVLMGVFTPDGERAITVSSDQTARLWDLAKAAEIRQYTGHTGPLFCLALSGDGRTLVTGAQDNTLRLWDVPQTRPIHFFKGHQAAAGGLSLSQDGRLLVSAAGDKTVRLWELSKLANVADPAKLTAAEISTQRPGHLHEVVSTAFRNDGNYFASGDVSGRILLWNSFLASSQGEFGQHGAAVTGLQFHPNNQQLISSDASGIVRVWQLPAQAARKLDAIAAEVRDLAVMSNQAIAVVATADNLVRAVNLTDGQVVREFPKLDTAVTSVALTPNNATLAVADEGGRARLFNFANAAEQGVIAGHTGKIQDVAFHADNQTVSTAGADGTVRLWQLPQPIVPISGHTQPIRALASSANGQWFATGSDDKTVRVWSSAGQATRTMSNHQQPVRAVAVRHDDAQIAGGDASGTVWLWNAGNGASEGSLLAHSVPITALEFDWSNQSLLTAGEDGLIKRWQLPVVAPRISSGHSQPVRSVAVTPDGTLAVSGSQDQTVRVWNVATGAAVRTLAAPGGFGGPVTSVALSADGKSVAAVSENGLLLVWNLADGAVLQRRMGLAGGMHQVVVLPENDQLATVDADQSLRLWRLPEAGKEIANDGAAYQVAATSPDGKRLAVGGQSAGKHAVIIRDRDSGKVVATLAGHEAAVTSIAFNKTGSHVITGSADKTARVWALAGAKELIKHEGYPGPVVAVALSDDGKVAFSSGTENNIRQWNVADGAEVRLIAGHGGIVRGLVLRTATLFSAADDGTVRLWNTGNGAPIRAINHGGNLRCLAVTADATKIVSGGADKNAKLWNAADGVAVATLSGSPAEVKAVRFSDDGQRVAVASQDGVRVWQTDGRPVERLETPASALQGLGWSADGQSLLLCRTDGKIESHPLAVTQVVPLPDAGTTTAAATPDGKWVLTGGASKTIRAWPRAAGKINATAPVRTLMGPQAAVTNMDVSNDGKILVASCEDKQVYTWDAAKIAATAAGQSLASTRALPHAAAVRDVSLSADGAWLATAGDDFVLHVWDVASGQIAERMVGHTQPVRGVAFAGSGKTIVTAAQDNSVRTWTPAVVSVVPVAADPASEPATHLVALQAEKEGAAFAALTGTGKQIQRWKQDGTALAPLGGPAGGLKTLSASRDGSQLIAVNAQGQAFIWSGGQLKATLAMGGSVTDAKLQGDATEVAVADGQARVRVFSVEPFRLLEEINLPAAVARVAWTGADEKQLVAIGPQPIGSLATRSLLRLWEGVEKGAEVVAATPDGTKVLAGGADGKIRIWRVNDGELERTIEGHAAAITELSVLPNGTQLVSAGRDKTLKLWSLSDGAIVWSIEHPTPVTGVSISTNGLRVATAAEDGVVRVWDVASGLPLQTFTGHAAGAARVRWLNDNLTIVSGSADKSLRVWKTSILRSFAAQEEPIDDLALFAAGAQVVTCSSKGPVVMSNVANGQPVRSFEGQTGMPKVVASRVDNQRIAAGMSDGKALVWNAANAELLQTLVVDGPVTALAWSVDNQKLAVATEDKALRIYGPPLSPQTAQPGNELVLHQKVAAESPITRLVFDRDNRTVWTAHASGQVGQWAYASPVQVRQFNHGGAVYGVAISRDGKTVVSCSADQTVRIWDATTGQQRASMSGHQGPVHAVALSPDESLVVSSGADRTVRLWDVTGGRQLKQLATLDETKYSVAIHPNGQTVAAAGADRQIHLFNLLTGAVVRTLEGHTDYIHCVTFNAAGTRLMSYGYAGHLKTWDTASGKQLFEQRIGRIGNFAKYAADNTRVLLSNGDGTARVFELPANAR